MRHRGQTQPERSAQSAHRAEAAPQPIRVNHTPGIITITDANTTIGYCRYDDLGSIEYLFVNAAHRRRGYAIKLLGIVEERLNTPLRFQAPISPLGRRLVGAYERQRQADGGLARHDGVDFGRAGTAFA